MKRSRGVWFLVFVGCASPMTVAELRDDDTPSFWLDDAGSDAAVTDALPPNDPTDDPDASDAGDSQGAESAATDTQAPNDP